MRIVVTGGCGLIGSHTADLLLADGHDVGVVDTMVRTGPCHLPDGAVIWPRDIRDPTLEAAFQNADVVLHLAAHGGFDPNPVKMVAVNVYGTANVMQAARAAGVRRVVFASSQAVYGQGHYADCSSHGGREEWGRNQADMRAGKWEVLCQACREPHTPLRLSESHLTRARSVYARTKLFAEQLVGNLGHEWGMETFALRYALTYGPRQSLRNPYTGIISIFSNRVRNGFPPVVYEDGLQTRDFTYVEDVARANVHAALVLPAKAPPVLNVGTGIATTVLDVANLVGGDPVLSGEFRPDDARHVVTDPTHINMTGWQATTPVADGLGKYAEWLAEQPQVADTTERAYARLRAEGVVV